MHSFERLANHNVVFPQSVWPLAMFLQFTSLICNIPFNNSLLTHIDMILKTLF